MTCDSCGVTRRSSPVSWQPFAHRDDRLHSTAGAFRSYGHCRPRRNVRDMPRLVAVSRSYRVIHDRRV